MTPKYPSTTRTHVSLQQRCWAGGKLFKASRLCNLSAPVSTTPTFLKSSFIFGACPPFEKVCGVI